MCVRPLGGNRQRQVEVERDDHYLDGRHKYSAREIQPCMNGTNGANSSPILNAAKVVKTMTMTMGIVVWYIVIFGDFVFCYCYCWRCIYKTIMTFSVQMVSTMIIWIRMMKIDQLIYQRIGFVPSGARLGSHFSLWSHCVPSQQYCTIIKANLLLYKKKVAFRINQIWLLAQALVETMLCMALWRSYVFDML